MSVVAGAASSRLIGISGGVDGNYGAEGDGDDLAAGSDPGLGVEEVMSQTEK